MNQAGGDLREEMARLNDEYWERFGFIFIICATGKSPDEMRDALRRRVTQSRETEIATAAGEQRLITEIRLRKLLGL